MQVAPGHIYYRKANFHATVRRVTKVDDGIVHFEIVYGASSNERSWWDNHRAYDLGYRPTGKAEDFRDHAMAEQAKLKPDPVGDFYQGGAFCGIEFSRIID